MKQLKHLKVGGSSYFIEGDSVIYAGNDGVKYVCGNQILQIYGYPEGLGSFTEPDFLKVGNKYVNRDRIIAYTNTGIALNTGTQYFETINYSNDNEYKNLCKYFDPTDSTAIDGWNIVKNKVCSFEPGSSNINGQIAEDIKPVTPTPPGPTPGEVVVRMTELVDDSWSRVTTITKQNSIYRMFMTVEGTDDPVGYVKDNLIFAWGGVDMATPAFAVSDHHTATEDIMVEFWTTTLRDEFMNNGQLEVYMVEQRYPETVVATIPAAIEASPQPGLVITRAGWESGMDCFSVNVNNEGSFASELRARLSTDCTDMDSSYYAQISKIDQMGATEYFVSLNDPYNITGIVHLYDNGVQIAEHNFSPEPPSGPQPQTGEDFKIGLSESQIFTPGETSDYYMSVDPEYGPGVNIKTDTMWIDRDFGGAYQYNSFWKLVNGMSFRDVNTSVNLPGTNSYYDSVARDNESITIYNFVKKPVSGSQTLYVYTERDNYEGTYVEPGRWYRFSYKDKDRKWEIADSGYIEE